MRVFFFITFLILYNSIFTQTKSEVKNTILQIGEQTEIIYEFKYKKTDGQLSFIPLREKIPCIKILQNNKLDSNEKIELEILVPFKDTIIKNKNNFIWRGKYLITVWDTGAFMIPPTTISTQDSVYWFKELSLKVTAPVLQEGKDIYDIKEEFIELPNEYVSWFRRYAWWILTLLAFCFLIFLYFKRKKKKLKEPVHELSLKERSLLQLESLENAKLWEKEQVKQHYIELSFILRFYLASNYNLNLMEKTSYETTLLLAKKNVNENSIRMIKKILDYSDLVKFAKSTPTETDIYKNLQEVKQLIIEISPTSIENV